MKGLLTRKIAIGLGAIAASLCFGFAFTYTAGVGYDDVYQHTHSLWLMGKFGLGPTIDFRELGKQYAPLWDLLLGIATQWLFSWLHDPIWVRHAFTFALWPLTIAGTYLLLRRSGERSALAGLCAAALFGVIRFGGHAFTNTKDFPAAAAFLLVTIAQWILLREWNGSNDGRAWWRFGALGILSSLPFLLRIPLLHHVAILGILTLGCPFLLPKGRRWSAVLLLGFSLVTATLAILSLYPYAWDIGLSGKLLSPLTFFGKFNAQIVPAPVFGHVYTSISLPWWYALVWLFFVAHPIVLVLAILSPLFLRRSAGARHSNDAIGMPFLPLLRTWIGIVVVMSFGLVMLLQPNLYDEERHILFLYPPLFLLAILQYRAASNRILHALTGAIIVCGVMAYAWWGQWAYVYKPIFSWGIADQFSGDYRGLCVSRAIDAMAGRAPTSDPVIVKGPYTEAAMHYRRRKESLLAGMPELGNYVFHDSYRTGKGFTLLWFNRFSTPQVYLPLLNDGIAKELWSMRMPSGDPACSIVSFNKNPSPNQ